MKYLSRKRPFPNPPHFITHQPPCCATLYGLRRQQRLRINYKCEINKWHSKAPPQRRNYSSMCYSLVLSWSTGWLRDQLDEALLRSQHSFAHPLNVHRFMEATTESARSDVTRTLEYEVFPIWPSTPGGAIGWDAALPAIPVSVTGILDWHHPSGRTMALGSTQPLLPWGGGMKTAGV